MKASMLDKLIFRWTASAYAYGQSRKIGREGYFYDHLYSTP